MNRKKTPFSDGGKGDKITMLLPKSAQSIHEDLKEIRRETDEESPRGFDPKENSRFVHSRCENLATHYEDQCSHSPSSPIREVEEEEEGVTKEKRQHDIFYLSHFDGSLVGSAKGWVEELDTFLQQHQILESQATRVVALHMRGKAYAWWIFEE